MNVVKSNSIIGKLILKNITEIKSKELYIFLIEFIKKLRKYGIKERFIAKILNDFFQNKYWNFIKLENVWLLSDEKYSIYYELFDPESKIFESNLFINIPLNFLKKSYIRFWQINDDFIKSFNDNSATPLKINDNIMPTTPEFLIIIKKYIGNNFKLLQIRELFYKLEPRTNIMMGEVKLQKERNLLKGVKELFVKQIEENIISHYIFCIIRMDLNTKSDMI